MTITYSQFAASPTPLSSSAQDEYYASTLNLDFTTQYGADDDAAQHMTRADALTHDFALSDQLANDTTTAPPYTLSLPLPPPPSTSSSSTSTPPSSRRRYRRITAVDPSVQRQRNVKHNEAEIRRRQRLNGIVSELASVVGCDRPYKSAILRTALDTVKTLQRRLAEANALIENLSAAQSPVASPREDLRELMGASCVAMHIADLNGGIVDCNELFALFTGFQRETLVSGGLSLLSVIAHHSVTEYLALSTRLVTDIHSVQRGECVYQCAHGVMRAATIVSWIATHNNKSFIVSIVHPLNNNNNNNI